MACNYSCKTILKTIEPSLKPPPACSRFLPLSPRQVNKTHLVIVLTWDSAQCMQLGQVSIRFSHRQATVQCLWLWCKNPAVTFSVRLGSLPKIFHVY